MNGKPLFVKLAALTCLLIAQRGYSFPEFSRHGYVSCTACHVSTNGGGILTEYGRNLSRELISTWGAPREMEVGHGLLPKEWADKLEHSKLRLGGSMRSIQTHRETPRFRRGDFFLMQFNTELAWNDENWAVAMSIGELEDPRQSKIATMNSSRYYGLLRIGDSINVRLGRFAPTYGLHLVDHTLLVRQSLGFGPDSERNTAELSWIGESHQFFLSTAVTDQSLPASESEKIGTARYEYVLPGYSRFGSSFWLGEGGASESDSLNRRQVGSLHGILAISKEWYFTGEYDRQTRFEIKANGTGTNISDSSYARLYYEPARGVATFLQHQYEYRDSPSSGSSSQKYGLGFQLFPRPHFECLGIWNRVEQASTWSDEAYLLFHYYL